VRDTFSGFALIQRCQGHKGRNIIERLDPSLHAGVQKVLRQAWDSPTAEQAERVLRILARRLDHDAPGVSALIHEGLDEMLTVIHLGLPDELRRSLGCTNAIESLIAVLRQVCRNVKHWRDARMALRWTANCNAGGREQLPPLEGPQAASDSEGRVAAPSANAAR
jgi:putative transposase